MLETAGLSLDDVTLVNVNFALTSSLVSKQVDAVIGAFRNFELNQLDLAGHKGRAFHPEDYGVPFYDELIVLAHEEDKQSADIKAFLAATSRAAQAIKEDPEQSWRALIAYKPELDNDLNRRAWRDTAPLLASDAQALSEERYKNFGLFAQRRGLINELLPMQEYISP